MSRSVLTRASQARILRRAPSKAQPDGSQLSASAAPRPLPTSAMRARARPHVLAGPPAAPVVAGHANAPGRSAEGVGGFGGERQAALAQVTQRVALASEAALANLTDQPDRRLPVQAGREAW